MADGKDKPKKTTVNSVFGEKRKLLSSIVNKHLTNSKRSGNTLDAEHFDSYLINTIDKQAKEITDLSTDDANVVANMLYNYACTILKPQYEENLKVYPRTPNNKEPKEVSDEWLKSTKAIANQARKDIRLKANSVLKQSVMTGRTPKRDQFLTYMKGQLNTLIEGQPEDVQDYIKAYSNQWIDTTVSNLYDGNLKAFPREITGDFPWSRKGSNSSDGSSGSTPSSIKGAKNGNPNAVQKYQGPMSIYGDTYTSFSGHDMVCTIDMPMPDGSNIIKVIGALQTLTYSIHDEKVPIRCVGDMNAKGYVFGPRTIAGTLIFSVFDKHWALKIMQEYLANKGVTAHFLADELPPFNMTVSCANEYGHDARLALYGITLVNEGQVMSINDVYTENTYQFYALDVDYLSDVTTKSANSTKNKRNLPETDDSKKATPTVIVLGDAASKKGNHKESELAEKVGGSTDPDKPVDVDYDYYPSTPKEVMFSEIEDSKLKTDENILSKYNKGEINEPEFHRLRKKNQENFEGRMKKAEEWYTGQENAPEHNKVQPDDDKSVRRSKEETWKQQGNSDAPPKDNPQPSPAPTPTPQPQPEPTPTPQPQPAPAPEPQPAPQPEKSEPEKPKDKPQYTPQEKAERREKFVQLTQERNKAYNQGLEASKKMRRAYIAAHPGQTVSPAQLAEWAKVHDKDNYNEWESKMNEAKTLEAEMAKYYDAPEK